MTIKVKYTYPLVFHTVVKRVCNTQTTTKMKLALYKIHVQRFPISVVINSLKLSKSSVYKYEKMMDREITYYRAFLKIYNKMTREEAYQIIFDRLCIRKNTDSKLPLPLALNDIFLNNISIGTVITKYQLSRATVYRRVKSVECEISYLKQLQKLLKNSKIYKGSKSCAKPSQY
jgi:predicted DNA-binding protein YlxM (UPF0122 family)